MKRLRRPELRLQLGSEIFLLARERGDGFAAFFENIGQRFSLADDSSEPGCLSLRLAGAATQFSGPMSEPVQRAS